MTDHPKLATPHSRVLVVMAILGGAALLGSCAYRSYFRYVPSPSGDRAPANGFRARRAGDSSSRFGSITDSSRAHPFRAARGDRCQRFYSRRPLAQALEAGRFAGDDRRILEKCGSQGHRGISQALG